jgi:hypothetical protein
MPSDNPAFSVDLASIQGVGVQGVGKLGLFCKFPKNAAASVYSRFFLPGNTLV